LRGFGQTRTSCGDACHRDEEQCNEGDAIHSLPPLECLFEKSQVLYTAKMMPHGSREEPQQADGAHRRLACSSHIALVPLLLRTGKATPLILRYVSETPQSSYAILPPGSPSGSPSTYPCRQRSLHYYPCCLGCWEYSCKATSVLALFCL